MKRKIVLILRIVMCILWIGFIFLNSMENGMESTEKSQGVTRFLNNVASALGYKKTISHKFVRSLAHFVEFAVLAVLSASAISVFIYPRVRYRTSLALILPLLSLPFCAVIASVDETIQKFSQDRASQFSDVILDSFGALCGILFFILSYLIFIIIRNKYTVKRQKEMS